MSFPEKAPVVIIGGGGHGLINFYHLAHKG